MEKKHRGQRKKRKNKKKQILIHYTILDSKTTRKTKHRQRPTIMRKKKIPIAKKPKLRKNQKKVRKMIQTRNLQTKIRLEQVEKKTM